MFSNISVKSFLEYLFILVYKIYARLAIRCNVCYKEVQYEIKK